MSDNESVTALARSVDLGQRLVTYGTQHSLIGQLPAGDFDALAGRPRAMQMTPNGTDEGWAYAHGIAAALNWGDVRCEACGAGRWAVLTRDWVLCDLCELAISVRQIGRDSAADPDRRVPLSVVRLPDLGARS